MTQAAEKPWWQMPETRYEKELRAQGLSTIPARRPPSASAPHRPKAEPFAEVRECKQCHRRFTAHHPSALYCSSHCRKSYRPTVEAICEACEETYERLAGDHGRRYCSRRCKGLAQEAA